MSFSSNVKKELCSVEVSKDCCKRAEAYGLVLFSRFFSKSDIKLLTEYEFIAERYKAAVKSLINSEPKIYVTSSDKFTVSLDSEENRMDLLSELGYSNFTASYRIIQNNIENECCVGSFLRGAFLSCGTVQDPKKEYHLEFNASSKYKCADLVKIFEYLEYKPKTTERAGKTVVYFKDSSCIEDILGVMGANNGTLTVISEKIYKDVRNKVNRKVNCDKANIEKTCRASALQIAAIKKLSDSGKLNDFPEEIRELAALRRDNPEMTFEELGRLLKKPVSRAGVNYRFKKIIEAANKI